MISYCAIDFDVKILTSSGFYKFRARMIKEREPYLPSRYGTWGINLKSAYNSMGDPEHKELKNQTKGEIDELFQQILDTHRRMDQDAIWEFMSKSFKEGVNREEYFSARILRETLEYKIKDLTIITPDVVDVRMTIPSLVCGEYIELKNISRLTREHDRNGAYGWKINPFTYSNGLMNHATIRTLLSEAASTKFTQSK